MPKIIFLNVIFLFLTLTAYSQTEYYINITLPFRVNTSKFEKGFFDSYYISQNYVELDYVFMIYGVEIPEKFDLQQLSNGGEFSNNFFSNFKASPKEGFPIIHNENEPIFCLVDFVKEESNNEGMILIEKVDDMLITFIIMINDNYELNSFKNEFESLVNTFKLVK